MALQPREHAPVAWGPVTRSLHWSLVLLILVEVPLGFWMVNLIEANVTTSTENAWTARATNAHHTLGFLVVILAFLRINWRLNNPTPGLPAGTAAHERYLARATQGFLYFLMFFYPLTGWAILSTSTEGSPIHFFIWEIPRLISTKSAGTTFASDLFTTLHQVCWKVGGVLLLLHVSGALWHQFVRKDHLLTRMWKSHG